MEGEYDAAQNAGEVGAAYEYPEGYEYYYQQQEGYDGYYSQQDGTSASDPYQYQYNYDYDSGGNYDTNAPGGEGQDYSYYNVGGEYGTEQQTHATETPWGYDPEDNQHFYLDQIASEQSAGYYYDEQGNMIDGYGGGDSPTNVFNQEAYWESGQENNYTPYAGEDSPQDETDTLLTPPDSGGLESVATPEVKPSSKTDKKGRAASPSKKKKTKEERIQQRQAALEKEEEERLKGEEAAEANNNASATVATKSSELSKQKPGFVDREKAKFQLKLRIARAIKRNRMPVQIRILPTTRKHLSPMDKYFGSKSVECVLSDIFWASIKGDIGRVKHLVEVEGESPTDSKLDPWNLHQTPLHWAAKGGSVPVINYLLAAGASPRCLDENGSLPLHLSCWAGYVDASILLLHASDGKDLYVQDYDAAMCPLDWVNVRGHAKLLRAIEKYQDSLWLPKFVDDLIRGIVRYKIKIFKEPPKKPAKTEAKDIPANAEAKPDSTAAADSTSASGKAEDKSAEEDRPKDVETSDKD